MPNLVSTVNQLLNELQAEKFTRDAVQDEKTRLSLLNKARKLVAALEDPQESIANVGYSAGLYMCVRLAIELEIPELLVQKHQRTLADLASGTKADPALILRIMRALAAMGFVDQVDDDIYAANRITKSLAIPRMGAGIRLWFDFGLPSAHAAVNYFKTRDWNLPIKSGDGPYQLGHNIEANAFTHLNTVPGAMENFNRFMPGFFGRTLVWLDWFPIPEIIFKGYDSSKSPYLFVDVAGGVGHNLGEFRRRFGDEVRGKLALEDQQHAIDDTKDLDPSIERLKYDFFTPNPIKGAKTYFFQSIMHDWPDFDATQILSNTASGMKPGYSKILIADMILPNKGATLRQANLDIGMLILHSGMQRSEKQWETMISQVFPPLRIVKFWHPPGDGAGIVEVERL